MAERTETPKVIVLIGEESANHEEYPAAAALTPGHLIEVTSAGAVQKNSAVSVSCRKLFAKEDGKLGRTIATAYATGEQVMCHSAQPGHLVYGWVPASATALVVGDKVKSNGDGTLVKITGATDFVIATCHEAIDNSAGGSPARAKFRIN